MGIVGAGREKPNNQASSHGGRGVGGGSSKKRKLFGKYCQYFLLEIPSFGLLEKRI